MSLGFNTVSKNLLILGALGCFSAVAFAQDDDPPARVARLNYLSGVVSMRPAYSDDWTNAEPNRPFSSGDSIYTDIDGRAEMHTDIAAIRLGPNADFTFSQLTDQEVQVLLNAGDVQLRVHHLGLAETFEFDTPNATVTLLRDGNYRLRVDNLAGVTFLVVREGTAEVNAGGRAATINPGHSILLSGPNPAFDIRRVPDPDDFDSWCHQRDDHEAHLASARYVPATLIGYEDLDDNGSWEPTPQYGPIWFPRAVAADWAPYRFGHWVWIKPWGWTWVDEASWGFAPFHYGRWVFVNGRWGWSPGPMAVAPNAPPVHPHYAPALVAWVGGARVGAAVSVGGPPLAWVTLGFGELYTPPYHCSPHYFNNVNVNNTRVVNNVNITNVYQTVYVNKTVYNTTYVHTSSPNAVVAMSPTAMASGQSVHQQAIVLKKEDVQHLQPAAAPTYVKAPQVAAAPAGAKPVPHPNTPAATAPRPLATAAPVQPQPAVVKPPPAPQPVAKVATPAPPKAPPAAAQVREDVHHEYPQMSKPAPPKKEEPKKDEHKGKEKDKDKEKEHKTEK